MNALLPLIQSWCENVSTWKIKMNSSYVATLDKDNCVDRNSRVVLRAAWWPFFPRPSVFLQPHSSSPLSWSKHSRRDLTEVTWLFAWVQVLLYRGNPEDTRGCWSRTCRSQKPTWYTFWNFVEKQKLFFNGQMLFFICPNISMKEFQSCNFNIVVFLLVVKHSVRIWYRSVPSYLEGGIIAGSTSISIQGVYIEQWMGGKW